ncbi:hypothetical protein QYF36_012265 [Acer negundo]|nr:hypothetical protein QYF36_012265 [Acer negundo]
MKMKVQQKLEDDDDAPLKMTMLYLKTKTLHKVLVRFRVFSEIELVLNDMKLENIKPTHEALSVIVAYGALIHRFVAIGEVDVAVTIRGGTQL